MTTTTESNPKKSAACDALMKAQHSLFALPAAWMSDIFTLGGQLTGQREPYSFQAADEVMMSLVRVLMAKP